MKRDFSENSYLELQQLVKEVEEEKWCDFTDWMGDCWYEFQSQIEELGIQKYLDNVKAYHKKIIDKNNTSARQITTIFENVNQISADYQSRFVAASEDLRLYSQALVQLANTIDPAKGVFSSHYIGTELKNAISDYSERSKILQRCVVKGLPGNNPAFDDDGFYGGNQGSAQYKYWNKNLQTVVKKYYPDFGDEEIKKHLETLNQEGCSYVAICNTIFEVYVGREEEFLKHFGFPMYRYGELNYDALVVDFYCAKDNGKMKGASLYMLKKMWEEYLKERGIFVEVKCNVKVTPETYDEIVRDGPLIIAVNPTILEDEWGNVIHNKEGAHAMTVTGATEDGRYMVSSWGRRYYVNPQNDYGRIQFQQVRYG